MQTRFMHIDFLFLYILKLAELCHCYESCKNRKELHILYISSSLESISYAHMTSMDLFCMFIYLFLKYRYFVISFDQNKISHANLLISSICTKLRNIFSCTLCRAIKHRKYPHFWRKLNSVAA